jgi:hypothetical protein
VRIQRPGVAQPGPGPVPARIAGRPPVDRGTRQAEQFGYVGDQRQVAQQQGGGARHRLDAELGGHSVKPGRIGADPGHPGVVEPPPRTPGQEPLARQPDRHARGGQQASFENRRQESPGMLGDQRDPGEPGRQQRSQRPAGHGRPDLVPREVLCLGESVPAQLLITPHALAGRADAGHRAEELLVPPGAYARPEHVVGYPGGPEQALVGPAVGHDLDPGRAVCIGRGALPPAQGPVDLEHPRGLGQEAAVRHQADHGWASPPPIFR